MFINRMQLRFSDVCFDEADDLRPDASEDDILGRGDDWTAPAAPDDTILPAGQPSPPPLPPAPHEGTAFRDQRVGIESEWQRKLDENNRQWEERFQKLEKPATQPAAPADPRPKAEDFQDDNTYLDALLDWKGRQTEAALLEKLGPQLQGLQTQTADMTFDRSMTIGQQRLGANWDACCAFVNQVLDDPDPIYDGFRKEFTEAADPAAVGERLWRKFGSGAAAAPVNLEAERKKAFDEGRKAAVTELTSKAGSNAYNLAPPSVSSLTPTVVAPRPTRIKEGSKEEADLLGQA